MNGREHVSFLEWLFVMLFWSPLLGAWLHAEILARKDRRRIRALARVLVNPDKRDHAG